MLATGNSVFAVLASGSYSCAVLALGSIECAATALVTMLTLCVRSRAQLIDAGVIPLLLKLLDPAVPNSSVKVFTPQKDDLARNTACPS